jgi:hypothetical protein
VRGLVVRQVAGAREMPADLQKTEAHQVGAERHRQIDDPHRRLEVVRHLAGRRHVPDELRAEAADETGEQRAAEQAEQDHPLRLGARQAVDENVDADVDSRAHPVGGAEFRHPHEHVDAQFLRPGKIELARVGKQQLVAGSVAVNHGREDDQRRRADEDGDDPFLEMIEKFQHGLRADRTADKYHEPPAASPTAGAERNYCDSTAACRSRMMSLPTRPSTFL